MISPPSVSLLLAAFVVGCAPLSPDAPAPGTSQGVIAHALGGGVKGPQTAASSSSWQVGSWSGPVGPEAPQRAALSLPAAPHELQDLVCGADRDVDLHWSVDGESWAGPTDDTWLAGDTVPMRVLRAGQVWSCSAPGAEPVEATVAPYHHVALLDPIDALPGERATVHYRGALLEEGPVTLRLGFDGWTDQGEATPLSGFTSDNDPLYWQELVLDSDGAADIDIPAGVASLRLAFETDDSPAVEADELLWGLDVPAMGPWLTVDPGGSLALHFATTARGPATVDIAWEGGSLQLSSDSVDDMHHLGLEGLPAGIDLHYSITDALGRSSPTWTTHRVDPAATELTVLGAADMQDDGRPEQRWGIVADAMLATSPDADLLVLPGDLATNDHPGAWWLFFDRGGELFARVPMVVAVGNHDTPGRESSADTTSIMRYFAPRFDGPGPEVGLLEYGPARLLLLNTEIEEELTPDGSQYQWADEALDVDSDASHTIVAFHRPAYDVGARFADEQHLFREVTELFDGRADIVLMGHEHIYQRFQPLRYDSRLARSGRYGTDDGEGVAYMVLPAAGNNGLFDTVVGPEQQGGELRDLVALPELGSSQRHVDQWHGFAELRIDGERMEVVTWEVGDFTSTHEAFVIAQ